jgi:phage terminase small subunit
MDGKLTPKQAIFAREFALTGNRKQSAIVAGCPEAGAAVTADRWLKNANVSAAVSAEQARLAQKYEVRADRTLGVLARIAYHDALEMYDADGYLLPIHCMSEAARTAIAGFDVETTDGPGLVRTVVQKVKVADRIRAAELLGKYQKLWTDKFEHDHRVTLEQLVSGERDAAA